MIRKPTNIPAEELPVALQTLAKERGFQFVYRADLVNGVRTSGAHGNLSTGEALSQLLQGTGLTYGFLGDKDVTIVSKAQAITAPSQSPAGSHQGDEQNQEKAGRSFSDRFRVAQADQGYATSAAQVEPQQQTAAPPSQDDASKIKEVTVTGSRIRGHENPSSPVYTITSQDMADQGLLSIDDVFRSIPDSVGTTSTQAMMINPLAPSGSQGNSSVNLGGFGASSTLVLINGRRTALSSILFGDEVNVGVIPTGAIDRIEVLPTAAAAIYGADAIGGVVNIILKKRSAFEANTGVDYDDSSTGGNAMQVSQDLSFGWGSGRFTGVASFRKSDPVTAASLGLTTDDFRSRGGYDMRSQTFGQTGVIAGFGSLPPDNPGTAFTPADVSPANFAPVSTILQDLLTPMKTSSLYIDAEQDVGSAVHLFVNGLYSKTDAGQDIAPFAVYGAEVPATNAFNPYGQPVYITYQFARERDSGEMPSEDQEADERLWQATFGADIDLPHDWDLTVYGTQADEASFATYTWVTNSDPAVIAALADSNPQTALNLFGNGTAQNPATLRSIISYWLGKPNNEITSDMTDLSAQANGTLFNLPTGAVKASFVVEHRRDELNWSGFGPGEPIGSRTAKATGAEFAVPLLSPATRQRLDLTLAARWDRYTAEGNFDNNGTPEHMNPFSAISPMVGLAWRPIQELKLRASWNKAFRAPVVHDLFALPYPYQTTVLDPLAPGGPKNVLVNATYPSSPQLGPETAKVWTAGIDWQHLGASGAGLSASLTYSNTKFSNRIVGAYTYFSENPSYFVSHPDEFPDSVGRDANGNLTNIYLRNINIAGEDSELWTLDATYVFIAGGQRFSTGASVTYTEKFEDQVDPTAPAQELAGTLYGPDRWRAVFRAGWTSPEETWAANLLVHASSSYENLLATSKIIDPPAGAGSEIDESVAGYTTVDLTGSYHYRAKGSWFDGISVTGGARNLFDKSFPFIDLAASGETLPFDPSRVDLRGRVVFVELGKKFQ
jgi:outer membrane receptor protein involved in Fe transport